MTFGMCVFSCRPFSSSRCSAQRVEEAWLGEAVPELEVFLLLRHGGEVVERLVHAAVLGLQDALQLRVADAVQPVTHPARHALGYRKCVGIAGERVEIQVARQDLVVRVERRPDGAVRPSVDRRAPRGTR